jgi:hypothetical protein
MAAIRQQTLVHDHGYGSLRDHFGELEQVCGRGSDELHDNPELIVVDKGAVQTGDVGLMAEREILDLRLTHITASRHRDADLPQTTE